MATQNMIPFTYIPITYKHHITKFIGTFSSVQFSCSVISDYLWLHELQHTRLPCPSPSSWDHSKSRPLSRWCHPSSHLILCRLLLLLLPVPPSIRVFYNESTFHKMWPKYWSFSFNISPSKEHPGLISFRMDSAIRRDTYFHIFLYMKYK